MNQYLLLRRLRGPLILVTIGVMALLNQYDVLSFGRSWPLILIVIGILMLAERIALTQMPPPPAGGFYPEGFAPAPPVVPVQPAVGQTEANYAAQSQEEGKH
jgi:hypothetical protein